MSTWCLPLRCDHTDDAQTEAALEFVIAREGRLDLLVNAAWGGYERMVEAGQFTWSVPFWQQPMWRWDAMFAGGVRALFACSRIAARQMVAQRSGLIANISFWAAQKYLGNAIYGAAKIATDRLTADMARELVGARCHRGFRVSGPRAHRTRDAVCRVPRYVELGVAPVHRPGDRAPLRRSVSDIERTGSVIVAAAYAREVGFTDIDGRRPEPLTLDSV